MVDKRNKLPTGSTGLSIGQEGKDVCPNSLIGILRLTDYSTFSFTASNFLIHFLECAPWMNRVNPIYNQSGGGKVDLRAMNPIELQTTTDEEEMLLSDIRFYMLRAQNSCSVHLQRTW